MRSPDQYHSEEHNGKGHIPGAQNIHYTDLMDQWGNMKPKEDLRNIISQKGLDPHKETVTYCHGGVTACIGWTALKDIGFENVRLYDGSWAEYSSKDETKEI